MNPSPNATVSEERSSVNGGLQSATSTSTSLARPIQSVLTERDARALCFAGRLCDRENRFFEGDFEELRTVRYLLLGIGAVTLLQEIEHTRSM
jgi:hypothetical protein